MPLGLLLVCMALLRNFFSTRAVTVTHILLHHWAKHLDIFSCRHAGGYYWQRELTFYSP